MGWPANEVARTSIWRLMAAFKGYRRAQGEDDKPKAPTEADFEAAVLRAYGA